MKKFEINFIEKGRNYTIFWCNPHCGPKICSNAAQVFRSHRDRIFFPNSDIYRTATMSSSVWCSWNRFCYLSTVRRDTELVSQYTFISRQWTSAAEQCSAVKNLITEQSSNLEGAVLSMSISIFNVTPPARNFVIHHKYFSTASVFTTEH